ncbi:PH domain-containing protein [Streptomyces spiramenti]|uniref:PH domain-containing protein n=1 Tax=Streptomyces spiramenti TaxID=2720606 RepID=A0ABX1AWL2_9ACTN|nr:PH domain-containing protein [Streptomyces spiramenti]
MDSMVREPVDPPAEKWQRVKPALLTVWRLVALIWLVPPLLVAAILPAALGAPAWSLLALAPLLTGVWLWWVLGRHQRSWRYREREDDLLISKGVLWRQMIVVPYGRMQLVEVTSGPLDRKFGLARLQLHTAAAATDATIPGLDPDEAERLRDRLTELGESRSAGL